MSFSVLAGPGYLLTGLRLIMRPGLRQFVVLPLLVNLLLFSGLMYVAIGEFSGWVTALMPSLPNWLSVLEYLLWPLFVALVLLMMFFSFTLVANIIAAPFNGFLAEKVETVLRGYDAAPPFEWAELVALVPRTVSRELRKLAYLLPRLIILLVISWVPGLNLFAAPLWLIFGVWMMAVQYVDYPADNHKLSWDDMMRWLTARRWQTLGFGATTYGAMLIPGLNLLIMPAAVAGATAFWVEETRR